MVLEYLQKYQEELTAKKIDIKEELEMIESKIKETNKFVEILDNTNESYFNDFTPRKINTKNMERMDELIISKKNLEQSKSKFLSDLLDVNQRLLELEKVIKEEKNHLEVIETNISKEKDMNTYDDKEVIVSNEISKLLEIIKNVKQYIFVDPMRSKLEIEKLEHVLLEMEQ